jgi:hypothetical protein
MSTHRAGFDPQGVAVVRSWDAYNICNVDQRQIEERARNPRSRRAKQFVSSAGNLLGDHTFEYQSEVREIKRAPANRGSRHALNRLRGDPVFSGMKNHQRTGNRPVRIMVRVAGFPSSQSD